MVIETYDVFFLTLCFIVSVAASHTAFALIKRVSTTGGITAVIWLGTCAVALGVGICTMRFIGMLAFNHPIQFTFDSPIAYLFLVVAMATSAFAIYIATRKQNTIQEILLSGLILGGGIVAMHYSGLAEMHMDTVIGYDITMVTISIVIGLIGAWATIWIITTLSFSDRKDLAWLKHGAAIVMGITICGIHYISMAAFILSPMTDMGPVGYKTENTWMVITVFFGGILILGFAHLTIFFNRRLDEEKKHGKIKEQEAVQMSEILDESSNEIYLFEAVTLRFIKVNRGAVANLGYEAEILIQITPVDVMPEFNEECFRELLQPLLDGAKKELFFETRHQRCDGTTYQVQVHLQLSQISDPPLFVAVTTDVTERKELEEELLRARKMEATGRLAASIAHEINTPAQFVGDNIRFIKNSLSDINSLSNDCIRLLDTVKYGYVTKDFLNELEATICKVDPDYLFDELPIAIDQSIDGIQRIANIVRAMKDFSHTGGSDQESIDINRAITNTIIVAANEWKYIANMVTHLQPDLPLVKCFPQEINQVLFNLIVNAAQAIEEANCDNSSEAGTISIRTRTLIKMVEISISDTGIGITDELKDRLFDPFFTKKKAGKAIGQGLSMAYGTIVNQHRGTIMIDTVLGQGTTLTVQLPVDPEVSRVTKAAA